MIKLTFGFEGNHLEKSWDEVSEDLESSLECLINYLNQDFQDVTQIGY
jgi:hypothetical protein